MARFRLAWSSVFRSICIHALLLSGAVMASPSFQSENVETFSGHESPGHPTLREGCDPKMPKSFLPTDCEENHEKDPNVLAHFLRAMEVMQSEYFAPWLGMWPDAIDWTAAVMGTHIAGAMRSLSEDLVFLTSITFIDQRFKFNLIDKHFAQLIGHYFSQDAFAIRNEAYDDILWVVLGWLETVRFIDQHSESHFQLGTESEGGDIKVESAISDLGNIVSNQSYHGNIWKPAFSHRARVFWELASHGWDTRLCGGGMVWNPRLLPYKNAITNELFIAASISMYLYFPGDDNQSPFDHRLDLELLDGTPSYNRSRDDAYLKAAIKAYRWLTSSNMTNAQGLYTDGFHMTGSKCDVRNEAVYSYNQGVVLTGQRGLWDATSDSSFISDGHRLIQNVISATGWSLLSEAPFDDVFTMRPSRLPRWYGLGRLGVMEDSCDASGTCSQDGQTFKGIFFHHLARFCEALTKPHPDRDSNFNETAFAATDQSHREACASYSSWLEHNAKAALQTLDDQGKFGQWWTAGLLGDIWAGPWPTLVDDGVPHDAPGVKDYRNYGYDIFNDSVRLGFKKPIQEAPRPVPLIHQVATESHPTQHGGTGKQRKHQDGQNTVSDPNRRGRGRTVETQGGGLALLRAYWKIAHAP